MPGNPRSRAVTLIACALAAACSSTGSKKTGIDGAAGAPPADSAAGGTPGSDAGQGGTGGTSVDSSAPSAPDAANVEAPIAGDAGAPDAGAPAGDGSSGATLYTCTFNATGTYPLGGEHRGDNILGTVIDTTAGGHRAPVGAIQTMLDTNDMIKFVLPNILAVGHTYEIALSQDHNKNRTCAGAATGTEAQWVFPVPAVTGDFTFNFMHNPRMPSCQDFPTGPIP